MSERTAPRPGGRATDHADAQRSDARGARHFTGAGDGTGAEGRGADTRRSGIRSGELVRGKGKRPEPAIKTRREEAADERAARGRKAGAKAGVKAGAAKRPVTDAPVDGTAALRVEEVRAEPVRVTGEVAAQPRLRVAPPAPISAPRAPFVASVIGVVVVGVLGILLINTKTNENSFRIADLQKQGSALDNQQQDLENQLVAASSIGNLDAAARRLGLVKADNPALLRLPDGKIIGVPKPADGRPAVTAQDGLTTGAADDGSAAGEKADAGAGEVAPVNGTTTGAGQANGAANGATDQTANGATVGNGQTQSGTGQ